MARYFGFRDRLKKKNRNLSISEKDVEWLKVATSFSWSPARRDYQWLEPEDYLSSFLNSSLPKEEDDTVPSSEPDGYQDTDTISFENGHESQEIEFIEEQPDYVPPYEFNPVVGDDSMHGIKSDILADLPHIDEYKLEISSALQRRGIHVEADSIQVPDELAFHLDNYHEKGRSSLDSYELRARLQYFKKQVIESYEQLNTPTGGFHVYDESVNPEAPGAPGSGSTNGLDNLREDEKFIVSSLDRLEASLRGDADIEEPLAPSVDDADDGFPDDGFPDDGFPDDGFPDDGFPDENSGGDSYSVSFSNPPSSFADDSWLVLPIDSPSESPESSEPSLLSDPVRDISNNKDNEDEIFARPGEQPPAQQRSDDSKKRKPLFKSSKQPDNKEVLKALDSINTTQRDEVKDIEDPIPPATPMSTIEPVQDVGQNQVLGFDAKEDFDSTSTKKDFSLFNRKDKSDSNGGTRERRLFDGKRKTTKEQRKEVKLPGISTSAPKEEPQEDTPPPVEFRTEVKLPGEYRTEVLLPGQKNEEPQENIEKPVSEEPSNTKHLMDTVSSLPQDSTVFDAGKNDEQEGEVSLTELLLKLRNDSDLGGNSADPNEATQEDPVVEVSNNKTDLSNFPESSDGSVLETDETISFSLNADENIQEPLVDPLEALAKPKNIIEQPPEEPVSFPDIPLSPITDDVEPVEQSTSVFSDNELGEVDMSPAEEGIDMGDFSNILSSNTAAVTDDLSVDSAPGEAFSGENDLGDSTVNKDSDTEPLNIEENLPYDSAQEQGQPEDQKESQETMNQRRARYIEEERKKLYSLIGRLEQNTHETESKDEYTSHEEILDKEVSPVEPLEEPEAEGVEEQPSSESQEKEEGKQIGFSTNRALSLMDYIDAVPDESADSETVSSDDTELPDDSSIPESDELTDNRQQAEIKDIREVESKKPPAEEQHPEIAVLRSETVFASIESPTSRPVVPINEEEVVMSESQKDEQVQTADVPEVVEQTEEKVVAQPEADTSPKPEEEPEAEKQPSMEFDQIGFEFENLLSVVECLAFASEEPIPLKKIARIYSEVQGIKMPTEKEVLAAVDKLNESYEKEGRSFRIKSWGRGIRMASHPQYANYIRALYQDNRPKKLSRTLMETLSIIAYSQPTTKPEVDFVRGVDSDYAVRKLLELGLIDIVGRSDAIGRPLLYGTSERFLDQFGLSEIDALPKLREVEELLGDPAFQKERLHLLALEGLDNPDQETDNSSPKENEAEAPSDNESE